MVTRVDTTESGDAIAAVFEAAPGTEILIDSDETGATANRLHTLQHVKKGDGHILLVPQPSLTDPNDPLRWPTAKKWVVLMNGVWYAFNGAMTGPIMAAGMIPLSMFFKQSLQKLTYANGATLACQGVGNVLWMPLAIKYGRRPVYLTSNLLMGVACIWLAVATTKSYTPFLIGRAFLGLFEAPIESLVPSTVTDIFHLHERGEKVSIYGLGVLGGNELGPMFSAFIIQNLGMNWAFWIVAIIIAGNLITMFFYMPETKYTGMRPSILPVGMTDLTTHHIEKPVAASHIEDSDSGTGENTTDHSDDGPNRKKAYIEGLNPFSRGDPAVSLRRVFLRPFVLLSYPTVVWSCFIYGMSLGWNVVLGASVAQLFAPPPYLFDSQAQGLIFLSPFIGSLIGTYFCGPLADTIATWYTRRNHGIREPEMRLPTCVIAAVLTFLGALISTLTYAHQTHWVGPIVGFGVLSAGAQMGATLAMAYSLDCHKELSGELMVTISCLKSLIAWIWTWCINDWIIASGMLTVFMVIAALNVAVYATTIVFYLRGKRFRLWIQEADLLRRLGLD